MPAFDANTTSRPSSGRYIIGCTRSLPVFAPVLCSRSRGAPSKLPPTLPSLARNSSMTFAFQSSVSAMVLFLFRFEGSDVGVAVVVDAETWVRGDLPEVAVGVGDVRVVSAERAHLRRFEYLTAGGLHALDGVVDLRALLHDVCQREGVA